MRRSPLRAPGRLTRRRQLALVAGLALILGAPWLAIHVLRTDPPPPGEPAAVGFVPPEPATPGKGFALGLLVEVKGCDKRVDVTAVAAGTAEYWIDNRRLDERKTFRLALPDASPHEVKVELGTRASDVTDPPKNASKTERPSALKIVDKRQERDLLIVEGRVSRWPNTVAPVVARYSADWLTRRGLGSCYLRLPALTGSIGIVSSQAAQGLGVPLGDDRYVKPDQIKVDSKWLQRWATYESRLEIVHGVAIVVTASGDAVDVGASLPSPDTTTNGSPTWACNGHPKRVGALRDTSGDVPELLNGLDKFKTVGAYSSRLLAREDAGDCSAVAVVVESSAGYSRDLVLLAVGALASLGFTTLVELGLALFGRADEAETGSQQLEV